MKSRILILNLILTAFFIDFANAQEEETLSEAIDRISFHWDTEALVLETYDGLTKFCKDTEYRTSIIDLMNEIHHYDSVLYQKAKIAQTRSSDHEIDKLIKDLESIEGKYSFKNFIHFLKIECDGQKALEKNSLDLKTAMGEESFDGQKYVIEVEMQRYVKHLTKKVDLVRKHVHHLHIK